MRAGTLVDKVAVVTGASREIGAAMAETLAAWDARLERTPSGTPAHLLTMVPDAPRATRRTPAPRRRAR